MFSNFRVILAVCLEKAQEVCDLFEKRNISANIIGQVTGKRTIIIKQGSEAEMLFDFAQHRITGLACP